MNNSVRSPLRGSALAETRHRDTEAPRVAGRKPRIADLFCCAGGAGVGYARAGFDVVGFDQKDQPNYPMEFRQRDVLTITPEELADEFDAVHASPPCQVHSITAKLHRNQGGHVDLVPQTRELLIASGLPYIIENVPGAPLPRGGRLAPCSSSFPLAWPMRFWRWCSGVR
jgi:DNA (cytosine-5)-methyltransferase 1